MPCSLCGGSGHNRSKCPHVPDEIRSRSPTANGARKSPLSSPYRKSAQNVTHQVLNGDGMLNLSNLFADASASSNGASQGVLAGNVLDSDAISALPAFPLYTPESPAVDVAMGNLLSSSQDSLAASTSLGASSSLQPPLISFAGSSQGLSTTASQPNPQVYCPVRGCPAHDASRHPGYRNVDAMRPHGRPHLGNF